MLYKTKRVECKGQDKWKIKSSKNMKIECVKGVKGEEGRFK
jgi:hypothetical protein